MCVGVEVDVDVGVGVDVGVSSCVRVCVCVSNNHREQRIQCSPRILSFENPDVDLHPPCQISS